MAIKPVLAIGLGATTVVGGAGGIYYAVNYTNTTSIEQEIINSKRTILSQSATTWDIKVVAYKTELDAITDLTSKDVAGLKKWCETTLKSSFKNDQDNNFLNAKKLCTTPTNKEKLLKENKKLAEDGDWEKKLTDYNNKVTNKNPIDGIEPGSVAKEAIKGWCEKTWEEEIKENDNKPYTLADKWCTVVGAAG